MSDLVSVLSPPALLNDNVPHRILEISILYKGSLNTRLSFSRCIDRLALFSGPYLGRYLWTDLVR
jgi:hypothetical protein